MFFTSFDYRCGSNPLKWALENGNKEIVGFFIEDDANINAVNEYGRTPLIWASENGYAEIARILIEKAANINVVDIYGVIPLVWASANGHEKIVKIINEKINNINFIDKHASEKILVLIVISLLLVVLKLIKYFFEF